MNAVALLLADGWQRIDSEIALVGAVCAAACAIPGSFLFLRRLSMMGDAISHAVLPGIAIAFLISGTRDSLTMFVGAVAIGLATAALVQLVHRGGNVDSGAAMGVVFTVLFAIGLVLIRFAADKVDLDPNCVLFGAIETSPLQRMSAGGFSFPRALLRLSLVLVANVGLITLLFKEFRLATFDPALSSSLGFSATRLHYLLMAMIAVTTVAAFESVGSVLVIAMLIVPPATAHLLTDRLAPMIWLSALIAIVAAVVGHWGAITVPPWIGFPGRSASTAGSIAVAAGLLFVGAWLFAPEHGLAAAWRRRRALTYRIVRDDLLLLLARRNEQQPSRSPALSRDQIATGLAPLSVGPRLLRNALHGLRDLGFVAEQQGAFVLTNAGRSAAEHLLGAHRLWESYLDRHLAVPVDHVHDSADRLEHVTDAALRARLSEQLGHPDRDPHGRPIPGERSGA